MDKFNFVALDFETANPLRTSICSIGMVKVINGEIVEVFDELVDPEEYFDDYHVLIHGITENDVRKAPTLPNIYREFIEFLEDLPVVAHFTSFDMSVLRHACHKYNLALPSNSYFDSWAISKKVLKLISNRLKYVANHFNIEYKHHVALEDARACAEVILKLAEVQNVTTINDLVSSVEYYLGFIDGARFRPKKKSIKVEINPTTENSHFDEDHPFFSRTVTFTGTLKAMTRREAAQKIVDVGGVFSNSITKSTNFLIIGEQDLTRLGGKDKSSKMIRVEELLKDGHDIEILSENDFLQIL